MSNAEQEVTGHLAEAPPIDYFDDIAPEAAAPATLERLTAMAAEAKALEAEINVESTALEEKKAKLDKFLGRLIPNVMEELAMTSFTLQDGSVIAIKDDIRVGITVDNRPAAWEWLEKFNYDGIIKTKVAAEFGRGELKEAKAAQAALEKLGCSGVALDRNVHPATLKSFIKERLAAAGENPEEKLPKDVFGIYEFKQATIKMPAKKKLPKAKK